MLTIRKLRKSHGGRLLFEEADMQVNYGERVALVGANGAGKSTLFSLLLTRDDPDSGSIQRDEWTTLGYLPQEAEAVGSETALDIATGRAGEIQSLEKQLAALEAAGDIDSPEYLEAHAKHEALADPGVDAKAKKMLTGLGFKESDWLRPANELSGGWVMRAHLARLLVIEPDLLLLDEPTNHLDLLSLLWLQQYLKTCSSALLLISHDREFMDSLIETVYEISNHRLTRYAGNYSDAMDQRARNFDIQAAAWKNQQKEIAGLQEFADRFRSVSSKAAQVQSKLKQIERMEQLERPEAPRKPFRFRIPQPERGGQRAVLLDAVQMSYGSHTVYRHLDLLIERGERTALVGPNGAGKSTLLKILAGAVDIQGGTITHGHNSKIGYFSQHRAATLDPKNSILEEILAANGTLREDEARSILGSFLFKRDDINKKTSVLSGGEKTRLNLVKFLVDPPNLLLMDEPTTHLDILTVESLVLALEAYEGTLVFISHDVHFLRKLATRILHINAGEVISYPGGYDYFLEKSGLLGSERFALTAA
jgi:ATP-binding cassette subfamily F protein 3